MNRILFVDDEVRVLEGLRLSLRRKRDLWAMKFVAGGAAALIEIARELPDVVVTDMRMHGMDGAELLTRVAAVAPQATRIILSGQMEEAAAERAVRVAHCFISKPCDTQKLEAAITRALESRKWLDSDFMRERLGGLEALPSLPRAYRELAEALREPRVSIETVTAIIQKDTAMAAKVLQLVNSSFFGLPRNIFSIAHAVSYLGQQTLKNLMLVHSVFQELVSTDMRAVERQQAHALASARVARKLFTDKRAAELAETAAMLHDMGKLVLASRLPVEYAENVAMAAREGWSLQVVEHMRFAVTHAQVGAYLLGLWGLPQEIIEAVGKHDTPWAELATFDTTAAVRIADCLAGELFMAGDEPLEKIDPIPAEVIERLALGPVIEALSREAALS
jgi:HD-like signal output (HDOD) protein/ActR/RegA family two-component response regulator